MIVFTIKINKNFNRGSINLLRIGNFLVIKKNKIKENDNLKKLKLSREILGEISSFEIENNFDLKFQTYFKNKKLLDY